MAHDEEREYRYRDGPSSPIRINPAHQDFLRGLHQLTNLGQIDPHDFLMLLRRSVNVFASDFPQTPEESIRRLIDQIPRNSNLSIHLHSNLRRGEYMYAIRLVSKALGVRLPRRITQGPPFDIWKKYWPRDGESYNPVDRHYTVLRDDDPYLDLNIPQTCAVIEGHPFIPNVKGILVRATYEAAHQQILKWCDQEKKTGILLIGQPGIGKTLFLYYLLILRLCAGKVTALQEDSGDIMLFHQDGVEVLPATATWQDATVVIPHGAWALVDSNFKKPSTFIKAAKSPFFVIEALAPREDPWDEWARFKGPVLRFPMHPWSVEELIIGRSLQEEMPPSEKQLYAFHKRFGPSARDAYKHAKDPEVFYQFLRRVIDGLSWAKLESYCRLACTYPPQGCYRVILIQPNPENYLIADRSIASRAVLNLLWQRLLGYHHGQAGGLYKQFLQNWGSPTTAQWILERTMRDRLVRGGEWPILPLTTSGPKYHAKRAIFTLPMVQIGETLHLKRLEYRKWDIEDTEQSLNPNTYYETDLTAGVPYDSFTYDPQSREVSMFQPLLFGQHDLTAHSIEQVEKLLEHNAITGYRLRYIAVIEEGQGSLKVRVPLALVDKIEMWVLRIDVY